MAVKKDKRKKKCCADPKSIRIRTEKEEVHSLWWGKIKNNQC
jgi:hypothetical protein